MNKAVFLDRDGTINVEKNYVHKIKDFEFLRGAVEGIKILNEHDFKVIVITNQSGIGRGYYEIKDVKKLHDFINVELNKHHAHIDAFYYCPHHPAEARGKYKITCKCRKPEAGLLEIAIKDFDLDRKKSFMVGDQKIDVEAGKKAGLITILLLTNTWDDTTISSDHTTNSLLSAAVLITQLSLKLKE